MHHFGLDSFANPEEHWSLQASLAHSISDELRVPSFASVLDASARASWDLRGTGFVGGKIYQYRKLGRPGPEARTATAEIIVTREPQRTAAAALIFCFLFVLQLSLPHQYCRQSLASFRGP